MKKIFKISFLVLGVSFLLGCGGSDNSVEIEEEIAQNKAVVEVSTESKAEKPKTGLLHAPANYIKTTVGQLDKAKKAAAVYENSALEHMDVSESTGE